MTKNKLPVERSPSRDIDAFLAKPARAAWSQGSKAA